MGDLVFSDVPGRVAKALLDLAEKFGEVEGDGLRVTHDLTQEELAQLVGASRETVNKALADFASRGWLRLEPRSSCCSTSTACSAAPASQPRCQRPGHGARPGRLSVGGCHAPRYSSWAATLRAAAGHSARSTSAYTEATTDSTEVRPSATAAATCASRSSPVGEVRREHARQIAERRPVPRQQDAQPERGRLILQPAQRVEVVAEPALGVGDHRGAAAQHGVAGQQRPVRRQHERQRVAGVAGGRDHAHLQAVDLDDVAVGQPLVAEPAGRVQRAYGGGGPLGQGARALARGRRGRG